MAKQKATQKVVTKKTPVKKAAIKKPLVIIPDDDEINLPPPPAPPGAAHDELESVMRTSKLKEAKLVAEIRKANLQTQMLDDTLVNRNLVYQNLFEFGQTLLSRLESIPDRIVDQVMHAKSRAKAYELMMTSIHEALEEMMTMQDMQERLPLSNKKTENL